MPLKHSHPVGKPIVVVTSSGELELTPKEATKGYVQFAIKTDSLDFEVEHIQGGGLRLRVLENE